MANYKLTQTGQEVQADLNLLDNNQATSGQVLTANGSGGCSWQNASGGGGSIDTSGLFTITAGAMSGIAFNAIPPNNNFYPTFNLSGIGSVKCSMIIIDSLMGLTINNITGDLYSYDNVQITKNNISSYFGKLLILKSDVAITGSF